MSPNNNNNNNNDTFFILRRRDIELTNLPKGWPSFSSSSIRNTSLWTSRNIDINIGVFVVCTGYIQKIVS